MTSQSQEINISRRDILKGIGAGALGMTLLQGRSALVSAQDDMMGLPVAAKYYGFTIGDFQAMVISDTTFAIPGAIMGVNVEADTVNAFLSEKKILDGDGNIPGIVDILVVNTGDDLILFDTGTGGSDQLISTLSAVGISPDDVTKVMISHFHPDHVNGLSNEGTLTYPNAEVFFPQVEFDGMTEENPAMARLQPALDADMVTFFNDGDSPVSGITAMAAHGHTPGHMAFMIESNGDALVNIVDAGINAFTSTAHPDWHVQFDSIPEMAVDSRKGLFAMSSDDDMRLFGYHFPFPGIGYAVRQGDADEWLWTPTAF